MSPPGRLRKPVHRGDIQDTANLDPLLHARATFVFFVAGADYSVRFCQQIDGPGNRSQERP